MPPHKEPTHLPAKSGGTPLGYYLGIEFHPPIALTEKRGYEFAGSISDFIDNEFCNLQSNEWTFTSQKTGLGIVIAPSKLQLRASAPGIQKQEWYESRYNFVLTRFSEQFAPKISLSSSAMIRQLFDIEGDARDFLARRVMNLNPDRLDPLRRPIHGIGLRLFFPPFQATYEEEGESHTETMDWSVNLKVESWLADPSKLFVEADASWDEPREWQDITPDDAIRRLQQVSEYLDQVRDFLHHNPDSK